MTLKDTAMEFFDACETGKGWDACAQYCATGATFSAQAGALGDVTTLEGYTEWMKGLLVPLPDGRYELMSVGVDEERGSVCIAATFHGTHTVDAGGNPPTGKSVASEYAYVIRLKGDKITHMTKIWNDVYAVQALGWA